MRPARGVVWQDVSGKVVVLDQRNGRYFSLNRVGTRVWQLLTSGQDAEALPALLLEEFDVDESRLRADVGQLLKQLVSEQLLEVK